MWKTAVLLLTLLLSACGTTVWVAHVSHRPLDDTGASVRWQRPERITVHSISEPEPIASAVKENRGEMKVHPTQPLEEEQLYPVRTEPIEETKLRAVDAVTYTGPKTDRTANVPATKHSSDRETVLEEPARQGNTPTEEYPQWNAACIAAFAVCVLGLVGLSAGVHILLAALFLGVVIGFAGLSTAKARGQQGKAFAMIAIVIGLAVLALLLFALLVLARGR